MKRKSNIIDLPSEFKLAEYKKCALWGLKEWTAALSIRSSIRQTWRLVCLEGKDKDVPDKIMNFVREASIRILSNPSDTNLEVYLFNSKPSYKIQFPIRDQSPAEYFSAAFTFNHDSRYSEWVNRATYIQHEYRDFNDDHNEKLDREENLFYNTPAWKMHESSAAGGFSLDTHSLFIAVDLRASDDELVFEFKKWLSKTRSELGITPKNRLFTADDFADWHSDRLLQYLDITFWAMTRNVNFTNEELSRMIFPQGGCNESRMRRTIRLNALQIISDEYMLALNNQLHTQTGN